MFSRFILRELKGTFERQIHDFKGLEGGINITDKKEKDER